MRRGDCGNEGSLSGSIIMYVSPGLAANVCYKSEKKKTSTFNFEEKCFFDHLLCRLVDLMLALIHLIDLVAMNVLLNRRDISLKVSMSDKK